jgi:hypothetical protein
MLFLHLLSPLIVHAIITPLVLCPLIVHAIITYHGDGNIKAQQQSNFVPLTVLNVSFGFQYSLLCLFSLATVTLEVHMLSSKTLTLCTPNMYRCIFPRHQHRG